MKAAEQKAFAKAMYFESLQYAFDPIELAVMEFKKKGGKAKVLPYKKSRKNERVIRVGVKN
jgi:hypothetical protein